jgi:hypothetical protein
MVEVEEKSGDDGGEPEETTTWRRLELRGRKGGGASDGTRLPGLAGSRGGVITQLKISYFGL